MCQSLLYICGRNILLQWQNRGSCVHFFHSFGHKAEQEIYSLIILFPLFIHYPKSINRLPNMNILSKYSILERKAKCRRHRQSLENRLPGKNLTSGRCEGAVPCRPTKVVKQTPRADFCGVQSKIFKFSVLFGQDVFFEDAQWLPVYV